MSVLQGRRLAQVSAPAHWSNRCSSVCLWRLRRVGTCGSIAGKSARPGSQWKAFLKEARGAAPEKQHSRFTRVHTRRFDTLAKGLQVVYLWCVIHNYWRSPSVAIQPSSEVGFLICVLFIWTQVSSKLAFQQLFCIYALSILIFLPTVSTVESVSLLFPIQCLYLNWTLKSFFCEVHLSKSAKAPWK